MTVYELLFLRDNLFINSQLLTQYFFSSSTPHTKLETVLSMLKAYTLLTYTNFRFAEATALRLKI